MSGWSTEADARQIDSVQVAGAGTYGGEKRSVSKAILFMSHVTQQSLFSTVVIGWVFVSECRTVIGGQPWNDTCRDAT